MLAVWKKESSPLLTMYFPQIDDLVASLDKMYQSCQDGLGKRCQSDLDADGLAKVMSTLSDEVKKLPKMRVSTCSS